MTELTDQPVDIRARRVPGVEARAGKFPGPSLIPALNLIQSRYGWLPREDLEQFSRHIGALRDQADLVLPTLVPSRPPRSRQHVP
jgi:NADH:ubiquinone oxidoreductase subunit E